MTYTRRDLGKIALAALPAGKLLAKPNSNFGGVQIGIIISPTALKGIPLAADEVLKNLLELGISAVEMQEVRVEAYAGAPAARRAPAGKGAGRSPEQQAAQREGAGKLKAWRLSAPMDKYKAIRRMYDEAGVEIYAFRASGLSKPVSDDELAYYFTAAQALRANQITTELPSSAEWTERLGKFAAERKIRMGYHNHTQVNANSWDTALSQSKYNGINFCVGHYVAAVSQSGIPFLEQHHDRITSMHLKDRKYLSHGGQNLPWGQGETQLKELLLLMQKRKYRFPASIELEYPIPEGSSSMAEIAKCLQFCKDVLSK